MKEIALVFGLLLVGLGFFGYLNPVQEKVADAGPAADAQAAENTDAAGGVEESKSKYGSPTALIPAAFGMLLLMCGTLAYLENLRKLLMHIAAVIALIGGLLAAGRGLSKVSALFGEDPVGQRATTMVLIMAALCLTYVLLSVRSFIAARKARQAAAA